MSKICKKCGKQKGGAGSSFVGQFYASTVVGNNAMLSKVTNQNIGKAPMFNPLKTDVVIPTGTTGIIPTGLYLSNTPTVTTTSTPNPQSGGAFRGLYNDTPYSNMPTLNRYQIGAGQNDQLKIYYDGTNQKLGA